MVDWNIILSKKIPLTNANKCFTSSDWMANEIPLGSKTLSLVNCISYCGTDTVSLARLDKFSSDHNG